MLVPVLLTLNLSISIYLGFIAMTQHSLQFIHSTLLLLATTTYLNFTPYVNQIDTFWDENSDPLPGFQLSLILSWVLGRTSLSLQHSWVSRYNLFYRIRILLAKLRFHVRFISSIIQPILLFVYFCIFCFNQHIIVYIYKVQDDDIIHLAQSLTKHLKCLFFLRRVLETKF